MPRRHKADPNATALAVLFGRRVREVRHERGLSQTTLATKAAMTVGKLSELENARSGSRGPTLARVEQVAKALGVAPSQLLQPQ
jgi:transcriptional regulator with XRE-family HTH domain